MSNMNYFEKDDIIHIRVKEGREASSVEVSPNITAELNERNEIIGVEILNASTYLRDNLLDTIQAKLLDQHT
ncbi:MAG TPA: DUF2283 domain-containing protein [Spirochaetia bacterium]|nr:DUF2283 domain-containing protein [Spirochaetia bacterium]